MHFTASILSLALALPLAPAPLQQEAPQPSLTVTHADGTTTVELTHPDGLRAIDWSAFYVELDGEPVGPEFMALLRSPLATWSVGPALMWLTVTASSVVAGPAFGANPCLLGTVCSPIEVLLRDASGYPDAQYTDQQPLLPVYLVTTVDFELTGTPFQDPQVRTITRLRAVVQDSSDNSMVGDWPNFAITINVHVADAQYPTAIAAFDADPRSGNLVNNATLNVSDIIWNGDHLTEFVLVNPFVIPANSEVFFSIKFHQAFGPISNPSFRHTVIGLSTDYYRADWTSVVSYFDLGVTPGAAALDIFGY